MSESPRQPLVVVASDTELPVDLSVWGTGGWMPPDQREALDWLTLARLFGWDVTVRRQHNSGLDAELPTGCRWVVVACDPETLRTDLVSQLAARLAKEPLVVITRASGSDTPLSGLSGVGQRAENAAGRSLIWSGPGPERAWKCRTGFSVARLEKGP